MFSIANLMLIPLLFPLRFTAAGGHPTYATLKNVSFDTQEEAEMEEEGLDSSEYKWEEDGISSPMAEKRIATIPVDYRPLDFLPPENLRRTPKTAADEPIGSSAATNEMDALENPMRFTNILLVLLAPMAALTFFCFLVMFLCIRLNGCRRYWHGTSKATAVSTALLSSTKACNYKIAAVLLDSPPSKTLALIDANTPTKGAQFQRN
ncbi:hypothetical protein niasHT_021725 [Heterodera trifolii]|uniref:Uncharacterized protein n=1 Tax=Heterodera trifolii TaxID=157864 RepID=A0ABD2KRP2_9BILA